MVAPLIVIAVCLGLGAGLWLLRGRQSVPVPKSRKVPEAPAEVVSTLRRRPCT